MLVQLGRVGQHILPYLYRLFAFIIMPRQHHQESRNLFVREARKLCQKEFKRWFRLATEVNPLMRYFKERMLPIPTLYVMGQEDHMFLAPVREQVAGYASSSLAMIQRCGHVCSVEQLDHFMYGDGIHLTVAHKREWSYGFKPDNKTVPLPCYLESPYDHQRESSTS
ncbi:hypothetical protein WP8S18E04_15380 [Aeromonas caviae]|nr:hypothetical protein WP8S18E04_15380 [Aeromonas caviae]